MMLPDPRFAPGPQQWLVGQWETWHDAHAAQAGLVLAVRRGLGVARAIELARETATDPATAILGRPVMQEWVEASFDIRPPKGWSVEIIRREENRWRLHLHLDPWFS